MAQTLTNKSYKTYKHILIFVAIIGKFPILPHQKSDDQISCPNLPHLVFGQCPILPHGYYQDINSFKQVVGVNLIKNKDNVYGKIFKILETRYEKKNVWKSYIWNVSGLK